MGKGGSENTVSAIFARNQYPRCEGDLGSALAGRGSSALLGSMLSDCIAR